MLEAKIMLEKEGLFKTVYDKASSSGQKQPILVFSKGT